MSWKSDVTMKTEPFKSNMAALHHLCSPLSAEWDHQPVSSLNGLPQTRYQKEGPIYNSALAWIRCKISFILTHSAIICLRGTQTLSDRSLKNWILLPANLRDSRSTVVSVLSSPFESDCRCWHKSVRGCWKGVNRFGPKSLFVFTWSSVFALYLGHTLWDNFSNVIILFHTAFNTPHQGV